MNKIKYPDSCKLVTSYNNSTGKNYNYGNCEEVAMWLSISIGIERYQKSPISVLSIDGDHCNLILNNRYCEYPGRKNVSIARAIAHFCLHKDIESRFVQDHESVDRYQEFWCPLEREAMIFAEHLLMPAEIVLDVVKSIGLDNINIDEILAKHFDVPVYFANHRYRDIRKSVF